VSLARLVQWLAVDVGHTSEVVDSMYQIATLPDSCNLLV